MLTITNDKALVEIGEYLYKVAFSKSSVLEECGWILTDFQMPPGFILESKKNIMPKEVVQPIVSVPVENELSKPIPLPA